MFVSPRNTKSSSKRASGGRPRSSTTSMTRSRFGRPTSAWRSGRGKTVKELRQLPVRHERLGVKGQSCLLVDVVPEAPPALRRRERCDGNSASRPPARSPGASSLQIPSRGGGMVSVARPWRTARPPASTGPPPGGVAKRARMATRISKTIAVGSGAEFGTPEGVARTRSYASRSSTTRSRSTWPGRTSPRRTAA